MTVQQTAEYLQVYPQTIKTYLKQGFLKSSQFVDRGRHRISTAERQAITRKESDAAMTPEEQVDFIRFMLDQWKATKKKIIAFNLAFNVIWGETPRLKRLWIS